MGNIKLLRWGLPLFIAGILIAIAIIGTRSKQPHHAQTLACVDPVRGCTFTHRGESVQLRFSHPPKPLQPFTMTLRASIAHQVHAEFQMQGMEMGLSRYVLAAGAPGLFAATITLPVCVSGRRDWKLYLQIDAQRFVMPFSSS